MEPGRRDGVSLDRLWSRGRLSAELCAKRRQVARCASAAGIAWFIANDLVGHQTPFFAPVAAVLSLGASYAPRLRRVAEVTLGVTVGVLLADLLVDQIGSGAWPIALVVLLARSAAVVPEGGQLVVIQAAVQSAVVASSPSGVRHRPGVRRMADLVDPLDLLLLTEMSRLESTDALSAPPR